jgi:hypothetical protein
MDRYLKENEEIMKDREAILGKLNDLFKDFGVERCQGISQVRFSRMRWCIFPCLTLTLNCPSQENRRNAGLRQNSFAYGETDVGSLLWLFFKVCEGIHNLHFPPQCELLSLKCESPMVDYVSKTQFTRQQMDRYIRADECSFCTFIAKIKNHSFR